jgi:hypothetical protein
MLQTISRYRFVFFTTAFLAAPPLFAQEICEPGDTMDECFARYSLETQEWQELQRQPTGVDTGDANLSTNTKNFLPLMALSGLLGQGTEEGSGVIAYDLNFPFLRHKGSRNAQLQAVVNMQPQLSAALRNALQEDERDDLIDPLEKQIGSLGDFAIRFTYNYTNRFLGRDFEQYRKRFQSLRAVALRDWLKNADARKAEMLTALSEDTVDLPQMEEMARTLGESEAQGAWKAGLMSYDELLDNQPQLHITAERKFREPLIGPDELAVKVTYEWSLVNFNASMEKDCHQTMDTDAPTEDAAAGCLSEYTEFVNDKGKAIEKSNRFSFSGEYVDIDEETIAPDLEGEDIEPVLLEPVRKLVLSLGWSRNVLLASGEPILVDLVGEYQDISDDPLRRDRGVVTLTFTRQIGNMSIPLGIVYANHGEFLTDVDERLSAHVGLRFNMSGGNGNR